MFRNTGANAFAKNQARLAYEDKRDLYCMHTRLFVICMNDCMNGKDIVKLMLVRSNKYVLKKTNEKPQQNLPKARFIFRPRFEPGLLLNQYSKINNAEKPRFLLSLDLVYH